VKERIEEIGNFDKDVEYPTAGSEAFSHFTENMERIAAKKPAVQ
jgi:hypothetical protein